MRLLLCGETRMEWAMPRMRLTMPSSVRATGASARTTGTATRTSPPPCAPPLPVAGRGRSRSDSLSWRQEPAWNRHFHLALSPTEASTPPGCRITECP